MVLNSIKITYLTQNLMKQICNEIKPESNSVIFKFKKKNHKNIIILKNINLISFSSIITTTFS